MTRDEEFIVREIQALRGEVTAFAQVYRRQARVRHLWLRHLIRDLEVNPRTQYKVHLWGVLYWLVNFPAVTLLFFFAAPVWLKWGLYITLIYSIYANFATDYGAMSAAMAAFGQSPLPEIPVEQHTEPPESPEGQS